MKLRVLILPRAQADLDEHFLYIGRDSATAAHRLLDEAAATIEQLSKMPHLGRLRSIPDARFEGLRSIGIRRYRKYLVFYIPMTDHLVIVRILHGARDLDRVLADWIESELDDV